MVFYRSNRTKVADRFDLDMRPFLGMIVILWLISKHLKLFADLGLILIIPSFL
ncbi:MAG: hypothetical protein ACI8WB_000607 [Phenylobacterium sp.]|jgi:hypothetical protein